MILYKDTKAKVCSTDGNTGYFNIVIGILEGDTLAPSLFIICLDYILQMSIDLMKENSFTLKKARSKHYSMETITKADYLNDLALLFIFFEWITFIQAFFVHLYVLC